MARDRRDETMEFFKEGTITIDPDDMPPLNGRYAFTEKDRIKIELEGAIGRMIGAMTIKVKIAKNELTTTDEEGNTQTYRRVFDDKCNKGKNTESAPDKNLKNKELKLTEAEKKNIKSIFELAIKIFRADVTLPSILGKPLELKDLFVKNSTAYPRWRCPYLPKEYYKYIDLFSVKTTKKSDSYGRPYWDYEVIEK